MTKTVFSVQFSTILSAKKLKSSVLLSSSLRKLCQFGGIFPVSVTLRLPHWPRLVRVSAFRLVGRYTSNTISVLLKEEQNDYSFGSTSSIAYPPNVLFARGCSEFTSAEPSITMAVASGLFSGHVIFLSRIDASCDF